MLDELRDLYQEVILDHGRSPRNFRRPASPTCHAEGNNPMCGDTLSVFLVVNDRDVIEDAAFEGKGCAISVASASLMTEVLKGKTVAEAEQLFDAFHALCYDRRSRLGRARRRCGRCSGCGFSRASARFRSASSARPSHGTR